MAVIAVFHYKSYPKSAMGCAQLPKGKMVVTTKIV